ncbi:hypothetical protein DFH09DRAFT_1290262 [Mycena vulgaris]|nr:hypothetical protein DFH09DRAFT_1290262 [Mycena vulgaris]
MAPPDPFTLVSQALEQATKASTDARALANTRNIEILNLRRQMDLITDERNQLRKDFTVAQKQAADTLAATKKLVEREEALEAGEKVLRAQREEVARDLERVAKKLWHLSA